MRGGWITGGAALAIAMLAWPVHAAPCPVEARSGVVARIGERGELVLGDGAEVVLFGVRLAEGAEGDGAGQAARARLSGLVGAPVALTVRRPPDRWNRLAADVATREGDVARLLVGEGLALADPGDRDGACRADLLVREAGARLARQGLWGAAEPWPVEAEDLARLGALAGRFAVVEGRIRSVGERRSVTYLNFGTDWTQDFTVTIRKRAWDKIKAARMETTPATRHETGTPAGPPVGSLRGRRIRVRGLIQMRGGPAVTIEAAEAIEIVDEGRRQRP